MEKLRLRRPRNWPMEESKQRFGSLKDRLQKVGLFSL